MDTYTLYNPRIIEGSIYDGAFGCGEFAYNHMVSIEWFDGSFYAVWGANPTTNREGQPGQVNVLSSSKDFVSWSHPLVLTGPELSVNPLDVGAEVFWQPELINVNEKELWCFWSFGKEPPFDHETPEWGDPDSGRGLYVSRRTAGADSRWQHTKIMGLVDIDGVVCAPFASQNPFMCADGRIIIPITLTDGAGAPTEDDPGPIARRWNVCAWTDDEGTSWNLSNPISRVDDPSAQWEPHFWEQHDGRIRGVMRNFDAPEVRTAPLPPVQRQLTVVSEPTRRGEPISFELEPTYAFIETGRTRSQVFRVGPRWCMLGADSYTPTGGRIQLALYFSRTGEMDFVAGPMYNTRHAYSTYSQGIERNGRLYIAWTTTENRHSQWRIRSAVVAPAPADDRHYVWPRSRSIQGEKWVYTPAPDIKEFDGREALHVRMRGSAGVEVDHVAFDRGQTLTVTFSAKALTVQKQGSLVLCSFGDRIPIRLGIPSFRPEALYAYGYDQWQRVGIFSQSAWHDISLQISCHEFVVSVDNEITRTFRNPVPSPSPRLYLGDGYEIDHHYASNDGSEFLIDLQSLATKVI